MSKTRYVIENAFAILKGRFRHLKYIDGTLERIRKITKSCCAMHNITLDFPQEEGSLIHEGAIENEEEAPLIIPEVGLPFNVAGLEKRDFTAAMLTCFSLETFLYLNLF